jgi:hypothetical protein
MQKLPRNFAVKNKLKKTFDILSLKIMPDKKSEFNDLFEPFKLRLMEQYDRGIESLEATLTKHAPEIREKVAFQISGLVMENNGVLSFNKNAYEKLRSMLNDLSAYLDIKSAEERLLADVNSAVGSEKTHRTKKGKTRSPRTPSNRKYANADVLKALDTLASQEQYQSEGVSSGDVANYLNLTPQHYGVIGGQLCKAKKHGGLTEYEQREGKWYRVKEAGINYILAGNCGFDIGTGDDQIGEENVSNYLFPVKCPSAERLENHGILEALSKNKHLKIPKDTVYNGNNTPKRVLKSIANDIRVVVYSGGYKGSCVIGTSATKGVIDMEDEPYKALIKIIGMKPGN